MQSRSPTRLALAVASLVLTTTAWSADPAPSTTAPLPGGAQPVTVRAVTRFQFDGATLDARDRARILADVGKMKDVTWQSVSATGHTDSIGPVPYNERLSVRRAQAVKTYLVGKGLDPSMIEVAGKAATVPVADNDTPAGRARNRRGEVEFRGVRSATR